MISLKQRLKNRDLTIGSWITLGHSSIAEIMVGAGFDWLTVDMEHSAITLDQTQQLVQIIELSGVSALVRVGENNPYLIKRVMDTGAHGVIVPMINTKDEAEKAVTAVKYPPAGVRGVGLARAQKYGRDFSGYKKWNENESIVIVQIEHINAVHNLESILTVKGIDGFIIGPYDLSGSMGRPGDFEHPDVLAALDKIKQIGRQMNAVSGYHVIPPLPHLLTEKISEGYRFIAFSLDTLFLGEACRNALNAARNHIA